jgi:hypothetical protein
MAQGVKSLDREPRQPGNIGEQPPEASRHLLGGLPGEGDRQNLLGSRVPAGQQVGQAVGQGPGLAGAGSRGHQQGRALMEDGLPLGLVQRRQEGVVWKEGRGFRFWVFGRQVQDGLGGGGRS